MHSTHAPLAIITAAMHMVESKRLGTCTMLQVLAFFAKLGLPLRETPPMMLVDGPTLNIQKGEEDPQDLTDGASDVPVFHTRGLCMSKAWGRMSHVAGTQRGYSQLHKQPSLDATLRPADLSARKVEVGTLNSAECNATTLSLRRSESSLQGSLNIPTIFYCLVVM